MLLMPQVLNMCVIGLLVFIQMFMMPDDLRFYDVPFV